MFLRPLTELARFVRGKTASDNTEVYYRCIFSEQRTANLPKLRGVRAFSRVRWQREGLEWAFGIGGFLPSMGAVSALIELVRPEPAGIPIPGGQERMSIAIPATARLGSNYRGWFRDILVTASGLELEAEGEFAFFEDESGIWNEKPALSPILTDETRLLLHPSVVLKLTKLGVLKEIACRRPVRGFFHTAFERIGGVEMGWCRTPDTLDIMGGALGVSLPEGAVPGGIICDRVEADSDGAHLHFYTETTKMCTVGKSVLKSMKKVSKDYILFQNGIVFHLPWVELQGGIQWELH